MEQQLAISYKTLGITRDKLARDMGYANGIASMPLADELDALLENASDHFSIQGGFQVFSPERVVIERDRIHVDGIEFETGRIIAGPLRGATSLAFFVVTAGPGITEWANKHMANNEPVLAYYIDALGSETVERAADLIEAQIDNWARAEGLNTTNRYSPGYCEWSVSEQHKLFSLLPPNFCGVSLTGSALMQPTKSVSGVIGVGAKAKKRAYACSICAMENCFRRNMRSA